MSHVSNPEKLQISFEKREYERVKEQGLNMQDKQDRFKGYAQSFIPIQQFVFCVTPDCYLY